MVEASARNETTLMAEKKEGCCELKTRDADGVGNRLETRCQLCSIPCRCFKIYPLGWYTKSLGISMCDLYMKSEVGVS